MKKYSEIKVGDHIKPVHFSLRKEPELIIGNDYYISFGMNKAVPCILLNILTLSEEVPKDIQIGIKDDSSLGYGDIHVVYSTEIGSTPEEAVVNTQTS